MHYLIMYHIITTLVFAVFVAVVAIDSDLLFDNFPSLASTFTHCCDMLICFSCIGLLNGLYASILVDDSSVVCCI